MENTTATKSTYITITMVIEFLIGRGFDIVQEDDEMTVYGAWGTGVRVGFSAMRPAVYVMEPGVKVVPAKGPRQALEALKAMEGL